MLNIKNSKPEKNFAASTDSSEKGLLVPRRRALAILLIVAAVIFVVWQFLPSSNFPAVSGSELQAVFLTNNQVYFGNLQNYNKSYAVLKNVFYLSVAEPLQQGATPPGPTLNLVKLGAELHGPQDIMYIPKDKIMFWENMKKDSQVVQAITNFLAQQKK